MSKISFVTFICIVASFVGAIYAQDFGIQASSAQLAFNHDTIVVNPGQRLALDCGVREGEKYRSCIWEKGGRRQRTFQVEDIHEAIVDGMSKPVTNNPENQCGIIINAVSPDDNGKWTCKVFVPGNTLKGEKIIFVTVRPDRPTLNINENPLVITEDEEKTINCAVPAARPAARIRWFIGTEDVTSSSSSDTINTDDVGTYRTESTLVYKFHHRLDRQNLRCSVEHQTLDEPEYSEVNLDIRFKPYRISESKIYGVPMDSEYEIKFNFTSNPVPDMRWYAEDVEVPVPGESGRYMANIKTLMDNIYMATLKIKDFTENDVGKTFRLHATNGLGEENFDISLSNRPAPIANIGFGTVIAIVVIVIFILILLFIIGVMRYRQMYCFASKDKIKNHMKDTDDLREEHDTESSTLPGDTGKKASAVDILKNIKSKFPLAPRKTAKEPRLDKLEEGDKEQSEPIEGKTNPEFTQS